MSLTKQYLRYCPSITFGLVGTRKSNVAFLNIRGIKGKYCAVGACENVIIWDLRIGEKLITLEGSKHEVTVLCPSPDNTHIAVGYEDGTIRVFSILTGTCTITFNGHKFGLTALQYDKTGLRLASGAKDTDVIVWDIVNESGLYRLKGHKGLVTHLCFIKEKNILVSSSKDTYVKFWDLDTQHCFKTIVGHRSEVYDFVLVRNDHRLITGSADSEIRVWDISYSQQSDDAVPAKKPRIDEDGEEDVEDKDELDILTCTRVGSVMRQGRDRVVSMVLDESESILTCHGNSATLEVFSLPSVDQLKKRLAKRQKKVKRKLAETESVTTDNEVALTIQDEVRRLTSVKLLGKICSVDLDGNLNDGTIKCVCLLNNNTIQSSTLLVDGNTTELSSSKQLGLPSHKSIVRTMCFSSDHLAIMSASAESVKIWNRESVQPIRTMACEYALSSLFAPGDRHVVIGTKTGKLQLFDVASGMLLENIAAHEGAIWSMHMSPDKRGLISGGADHTLKFWNFELINDEKYSATSKRLTIEPMRTLKMDEDILCVKYSRDQRLVAASLLDNTVKVFFADTLKFFLSLYGHKLPVLCMDISSDSTIIITGSADKNVKIWGLDFGDCHKSIFAHDESIMCIQFIPRTHMFFTGAKDKKIKQWDADSFQLIATLEGHHGEVLGLAVSTNGKFLVSSSQDRSLRLWEKSQEILVMEEEREMDREREFEESVSKEDEPVVAGETTTEVALAGKKTIETVKAAEQLMEALEIYKVETFKLQIHKAECQKTNKKLPLPDLNPLIMAYGVSSPGRYLLEVIKKIKSSELEECLLVLPFSYVIDLLKALDVFLTSGWEVELVCRCLFFLLRVHHGQVTSNQVLLPVIDRLRTNALEQVTLLRDRIGFNMAGLQFLKRQIEKSDEVVFFTDATNTLREKKKKEKNKVILAIKT